MVDAEIPPNGSRSDGAASDHDELFEELAAKYELRPQPKQQAMFESTWMDQDDTGDYDPAEERRTQRARRNRLRLRTRNGFAAQNGNEDEVHSREPPKAYRGLVIKLQFPSVTAKAALEKLLDGDKSQAGFGDGYRLRRKFDITTSSDGRNPRKALHNLRGHPTARGCWECYELGLRCPLLDDEHAWPCFTCVADDHNCELITPPVSKRACERCRRRRTTCSYTYTNDHSGDCHQCLNDSFHCIAGPHKDHIRTRIRYDRDWANHPAPTTPERPSQQLMTCSKCLEAGRHCSFSTGRTSDVSTTSAA